MSATPDTLSPAFSDINLFSSKDSFFLRTLDGKNSLTIDRKTGSVSNQNADVSGLNSTTVYGVLGNIKLLSGHYLLLIKKRALVSEIFGNKIYRIVETMLLPYGNIETLKETDRIDEERYVSLLKSTFRAETFYYSYSYDMTIHTQNWFKSEKKSLWREADDHFWWNKYLSKDLIAANAEGWIIPVIRGFVEFKDVVLVNGKSFRFGILSRLSVKRVGTRYNTRGADKSGNVANYVETEQIVAQGDNFISFMQVRGSIPLKWSQKPDLTYKPKLKIVPATSTSTNPFHIHMNDQLERYSKVVIVNLINSTGSEGKLADAFLNQHNEFKNNNVTFINFDFHKVTKRVGYGAGIDQLIAQVQNNMDQSGYFHVNFKTRQVIKTQNGILRVNCIDCLDRTNVCESSFARVLLQKALQDIGLISNTAKVSQIVNLEYTFKNTWADNGDAMSNLYAGTGALKADFTRTGKRSILGVLNDGYNSATRYYLNNFTDGTKQDGLNLVLGKYTVEKGDRSPFLVSSGTLATGLNVAKYAFVVGLVLVLINLLQLIFMPDRLSRLGVLGMLVVVTGLDGLFLRVNQAKVVNKPLLKRKIKSVLNKKTQ
ncbi:phosphatidylinositide phosphatase [Acrasis kona]|uniref:Phosphatidylinositide phosphatase n=1 Tax=Acrasis kona TaxID=1008807 RepID=A0AAW2ZEP8_9EUKA